MNGGPCRKARKDGCDSRYGADWTLLVRATLKGHIELLRHTTTPLSWGIPTHRCVRSNSRALSRWEQCDESSIHMRNSCQESSAWINILKLCKNRQVCNGESGCYTIPKMGKDVGEGREPRLSQDSGLWSDVPV